MAEDGSGRETRRYVVRGRVQGVAFRWFTRETARRLGVVGWARNRRDGTVEILAAGGEAALATFRAALEEGPRAARVVAVDEEPAADEGWTEFAIRVDT